MKLEELINSINTPGWDWPERDFAWLASKSGLHRKESDGSYTSIFFIHGGRIKEQANIPYGNHAIEAFVELIRAKASGLDDPTVCWYEDTGGGDSGFWVEGTRLPREDDLLRLEEARERQRKEDARALEDIKYRQSCMGVK